MKTTLPAIAALFLSAVSSSASAQTESDSFEFSCPAQPTKVTLRQHYVVFSNDLQMNLDQKTGLYKSVQLTKPRMSISREKAKKLLSTISGMTSNFDKYGKLEQATRQAICLYPVTMKYYVEGIDRVSKQKVRKKVIRDILVPAIANIKILT